MKILSIKFLNLNSLKGEHQIRFDGPPFTESGLFAITGPTGSGKTTILDAITVALYGRIHRHDRETAEILTRHTGEAYAEIEFEVKGVRYRSKWSIKRSRLKTEGKIQPQKMEFSYAGDNKLICEHPLSEVQQAIVNTCGLDYHQFLRSVMLSQGDFTRFLKASQNERSELLEKITDTGIYSIISQKAFERSKKEKEIMESLRSRLQGIELFSEETKRSYNQKLELLTQEASKFKEEKFITEKKLGWLVHCAQLAEKKSRLQAELQHFLTEAGNLSPEFEKLRLHRQAMEFRPAVTEIDYYAAEVEKLSAETGELEKQMPNLKKAVEDALQVFLAEQEKIITAEKDTREQEQVYDEVIQKDERIMLAKGGLQKLQAQYDQLETEINAMHLAIGLAREKLAVNEGRLQKGRLWLEQHRHEENLEKEIPVFTQYRRELAAAYKKTGTLLTEKQSYETLLSENEKKIITSGKLLDQHREQLAALLKEKEAIVEKKAAVSAGKVLHELETELIKLPSEISAWRSLKEAAGSFLLLNEQKTGLENLVQQTREQQKNVQASVLQLQEEKKQSEAHLEDLRSLVEIQMRIQNYEADREQLKNGEECPLCGSRNHPFIEGNYRPAVNEAESKRKKQQQVTEEITQALNNRLLELNTIEHTLRSNRDQLEKTASGLQRIEAQFEETGKTLVQHVSITESGLITEALKNAEARLSGLQAEVGTIRELDKNIRGKEMAVAEMKETVLRLEADINRASDKAQDYVFHIQRLNDELKELKNQEDMLEQAATLFLSRYNLHFRFADAERDEAVLARCAQVFQKAVTEMQALAGEKIMLENQLTHESGNLLQKQDLMQVLGREKEAAEKNLQALKLEREQLFGTKDPKKEREQLFNGLSRLRLQMEKSGETYRMHKSALENNEFRLVNAQQGLKRLKDKLEALTANLLQRLQALQVTSVEALKSLYLDETKVAEVESLRKASDSNIASVRSLLESTEKDLLLENARQLTDETQEALQEQLVMQEQHITALNQEIGGIIQKMAENNRLEAQNKKLSMEMEAQKKESARWEKLSSMIGSADGKKFSRFAQGLTLMRLTELANRHLMKLSDRYRIIKTSDEDLELKILDTYQADVIRPVTTLSGGESFLVSLALALGLSDLAGKKTQINSLFIDEGFGTLDADTLEVAISALESLQAAGKTICIISHVEALKEGIGVQIRLQKQPGGFSKISLFSYGEEVIV